MKSMGGVAILHPQDSYNNHHVVVDNMFNTPKKSHRNVKLNQHPDNRTRTQQQPKGKNNISNRNTTKTNKQSNNEFFAGFAFVESPPPSSVPLPGFFTAKNMMMKDDDPTTELRRILGLTLSN